MKRTDSFFQSQYKQKTTNTKHPDIHGQKGLLDYFGTQTIPFKYDTLYASHNLYTTGFIAKKEGMYGFISKK